MSKSNNIETTDCKRRSGLIFGIIMIISLVYICEYYVEITSLKVTWILEVSYRPTSNITRLDTHSNATRMDIDAITVHSNANATVSDHLKMTNESEANNA